MRPLCRFAVPAAAAIFLCVYLLPEGFDLPLGGFCMVLGLLCLLLRNRTAKAKAALTCFGLAFGLLWTAGWNMLFRTPALALDQHTQVHTCTVADYPSNIRWGRRVTIRIRQNGPDPTAVLYGRAEELDGLRPGDVIRGTLTTKAIHRQLRNRIDYNQSRAIFLTADGLDMELIHRPVNIPLQLIHREFAHQLKAAIAAAFPDDVSGFAAALATGDKSLLPPGLYAAFQRSGLAHIVAVSGLHVAFLIAALTLIFGKGRRSTACIGMALALFFALSVGSTPSVLRAVFMAGMLLLAPLVGREPDGPTTLSFILLLLLLGCPWAAASAGLQLSFAAVAGIYLITPDLTEWGRQYLPKNKVLRGLLFAAISSLSATLGALLFTTPLAALYFGLFSPAGLLTNLLTLWAVSLTFLGSLLAGLLGLFSPTLSGLLAAAAAWPARYVTAVAVGVGRLPFASLDFSSPYLLAWGILSYGVILLLVWRRGRGVRPWVPVSACLGCLAAALLFDTYPLRSGAVTCTILNPEGGSCALVCSDGHAAVLNCGSQSGADPGDLAADRLLAMGQGTLDTVVVTSCARSNADGIPQLLARIPTQILLLPARHENCARCAALRAAAADFGCQSVHMNGDTACTIGSAALTIYEPMDWNFGHSIHCAVDDFDILLTGDLEPKQERRLAKYKPLPHADLLVTETGHICDTAFLLETSPDSAVLTGDWAHPRTLEQLGAAGCTVWPADQMGNLTFTISRK